MVQVKDVRLSPMGFWFYLDFIDGYRAVVMGGKVIIKDGVDWARYYLYPTEELRKRYDLSLEKLDENNCLFMEYPKDFILNLNEDDPSRVVKFCLLNFEGKRTPLTDKLLGMKTVMEDVDKIINNWAKDNSIDNESILRLKSLLVPKIQGVSEPEEIIKLKKKNYALQAENAYGKEQVFTAKTNNAKYVKENFLAIADAVLPFVKKAIDVEREETKRGMSGGA